MLEYDLIADGFMTWTAKGKLRIQRKVIAKYLSRRPVSEWGFKDFYLNALMSS